MAVERPDGGQGKLPDDNAIDERWRVQCPRNQWTFTSASEFKDIKYHLGSQRLTHYIRDHCEMDPGLDYWAWIPHKLRQELRKEPNQSHALVWGLLVYIEFNYVTFLYFWGLFTFCFALILCLALSVRKVGTVAWECWSSYCCFLWTTWGAGNFFWGNFAKHSSLFK
jgi:hypothetical protein